MKFSCFRRGGKFTSRTTSGTNHLNKPKRFSIFLKKGYENYGYKVTEVPVGAIKERVNFILENLKNEH